MCKKNIYGHRYTYEVCPHCEEEVRLKAELMVQTCPKCGKRIVTCSMCRACDTEENYCTNCCLSYQADVENKETEALAEIEQELKGGRGILFVGHSKTTL